MTSKYLDVPAELQSLIEKREGTERRESDARAAKRAKQTAKDAPAKERRKRSRRKSDR